MEQQTDLFGIPVPSTDRVFLTFVVIHIAISLVAVFSGLRAMLSVKSSKRHKRNGSICFWSLALSFVTIVILSVMRWLHNAHLLTIGVLRLSVAYTGRSLTKKKESKGWTRIHTICMGLPFVLLLTGFYVDNGKNLPFWRMFPEWFFYVFPALVGIPIIIRALIRHPLNRPN